MNVGSLRRYWPNGSVQQILAFDGNGVGQGQQRYFHDNDSSKCSSNWSMARRAAISSGSTAKGGS